MNKLFVAVLAPHFEEYSLQLANALCESHRVTLYIELSRLNEEYYRRELVFHPELTIRNVPFSSPFAPFQLCLNLIRSKIDILHIQEPSGLMRAIACLCALIAIVPFSKIVLTVHDPVPHPGRDEAIARKLSIIRRITRRFADIVCLHGTYCFQAYESKFALNRQKLCLIDHGVILSESVNTPRPNGPLRILFFGRMERYKGVEVLLEAVKICRADGTEFSLTICGEGPELDRLQPEFGKLPKVDVLAGYAPAWRLIELLKQSDCVALPYLSATQSGVLAAAFGNGRFVVGSQVGGIPDIVQNMVNGILVPPNDPVALARAFQTVANDDELRTVLRQGAVSTAKERLDWNNIANLLSKSYVL